MLPRFQPRTILSSCAVVQPLASGSSSRSLSGRATRLSARTWENESSPRAIEALVSGSCSKTRAVRTFPPVRSTTLLRTAPAWERIGSRWLSRFGGVVLMEASKQIYAAAAVRAKRKRKPVIVPFPQPAAGRSAERTRD